MRIRQMTTTPTTTATGDGGIGEIVTTLFKGLTLPPSATKMERILSHFDKMTAIKASRALNAEEQRIYANMSRHVVTHFDAASKAIPIMLKKYKQRALKMNGGVGGVGVGGCGGGVVGGGQHGGGRWDEAVQFVAMIGMFIGKMIDWIKEKFAGMADDKTMSFLEKFQPSRLMMQLNIDPENPENAGKVTQFSEKMNNAIEGMQRTVVNGIGGAATASMDMVLNAFSMLPGLGTTLLIWRMFQNVMVILGASMNVQAGTVKTAQTAAAAAAGVKEGAGGEEAAAGGVGGEGVKGGTTAAVEGAGGAGGEEAAEGGEVVTPPAGGVGAAGAGGAGGGTPPETAAIPRAATGAGGTTAAEGGKKAAAIPVVTPPPPPAVGGQGGGGAMNQNRHHSIINGARALHQSLKRFSGLSARMGSFATSSNNSNSKTRTNRKHAPININDINPLASSYALKRLFLFQQPGLKPVAAT